MKSSNPIENPETRQRLLDAAAEVFVEHGFRGATVRDICTRAGANVAAVNYHFRDKDGLYSAVLQHGLALALRQHPPDRGVSDTAPPEERLHVFIRSFLHRLLESGSHTLHARLMVREMIEPTGALEVVVREHIRPLAGRLHGILRELLGSGATDEQMRHAAMSIVGQCCFYRHAEQVIAKLFPEQRHTPAAIQRLADHVTRFSLAGLKACAAEQREHAVSAEVKS